MPEHEHNTDKDFPENYIQPIFIITKRYGILFSIAVIICLLNIIQTYFMLTLHKHAVSVYYIMQLTAFTFFIIVAVFWIAIRISKTRIENTLQINLEKHLPQATELKETAKNHTNAFYNFARHIFIRLLLGSLIISFACSLYVQSSENSIDSNIYNYLMFLFVESACMLLIIFSTYNFIAICLSKEKLEDILRKRF